MYVIINIHWDGGWLQDHVTEADRIPVNARQNALWTQIATTFRNYDQRLLFAGTNEVHADFNPPTDAQISVQQSYNQTFVTAVRATGGNNASRSLVVQTYNTNVQHGLAKFTLPTDSAVNRLMVEVHYYDPYDFTLNPNGSCNFWGAPFPTRAATATGRMRTGSTPSSPRCAPSGSTRASRSSSASTASRRARARTSMRARTGMNTSTVPRR